jgi:octaprenyl-diphosphate synthase
MENRRHLRFIRGVLPAKRFDIRGFFRYLAGVCPVVSRASLFMSSSNEKVALSCKFFRLANSVDASALPSLHPSQGELKERIYARVGNDLARIDEEINSLLVSDIPLIPLVGRHIMGSGGKRLRPLLMILAARLCGYRGNRDAPLAVVFEFLHAATLLHDDVVDHAETRRNKPAANTIWGNAGVVLVGDFLYSKAILMAIEYQNLKILEVLLDATTKMSEGEVLQLINSDNLEISEKEYLKVIVRKTAVLISAACQVGAIFGGGGAAEERALNAYGHNLGIAFQLIDDTLDFTGEAEELGKPVGNDIREGKATLPLIHALRNAKPAERDRLRQIFSADEISARDEMELRNMVVRTGGIEYTRNLAITHANLARKALKIFSDGPEKEILDDTAGYVVCRRT